MKNELWSRRSLIWDFAILDLKVRYRNSVLGFVWTFLEPLLLLSILYVVFTNVFKSQIEFFPLYLLLGLIMWNMFVRGTQMSLSSILSRGGILSQIHIPIEIPPISACLTSTIMLTFEITVLGIFMVAFKFIPPLTIVILPLVIILEFFLVLGLSLPLSVLNVRFRDIQFVWSVILQAGFFLTPIFYKVDILPQWLQSILHFNPMAQILNFAHDAALYGKLPTGNDMVIASMTTLIIFLVGYTIFRKLSSRVIEEL